jgi:hypothetical protein
MDRMLDAELAELLHLEFVLGTLPLTGGVIPVATVGAFEEDVAFLVLHGSLTYERRAAALQCPVV